MIPVPGAKPLFLSAAVDDTRRYRHEMVWAQNKINRTCKDDPTGHCTRREKERQTEKEMGRQRNGMDRFKVG